VDDKLIIITFGVDAELGRYYEELFKKIIQDVEWLNGD
jgi:hypothetical protein